MHEDSEGLRQPKNGVRSATRPNLLSSEIRSGPRSKWGKNYESHFEFGPLASPLIVIYFGVHQQCTPTVGPIHFNSQHLDSVRLVKFRMMENDASGRSDCRTPPCVPLVSIRSSGPAFAPIRPALIMRPRAQKQQQPESEKVGAPLSSHLSSGQELHESKIDQFFHSFKKRSASIQHSSDKKIQRTMSGC
jgi:hypothetical protein